MKPRHLVTSLTLTAALLTPNAQAGDTPAGGHGWWNWLEATVREWIWGGGPDGSEGERWEKEGPTSDPLGKAGSTSDPLGKPVSPPPAQPGEGT
jgi:hypothetical protein